MEGTLGETGFCISGPLLRLSPEAGTAKASTMMAPRPLVILLLLPSLTLLVSHLSSSQDISSESSGEQQLCGLKEHPTVAFEDLKPWVSNFTFPGARDFSQLALDPSRNQLIVGARTCLVSQLPGTLHREGAQEPPAGQLATCASGQKRGPGKHCQDPVWGLGRDSRGLAPRSRVSPAQPRDSSRAEWGLGL
ncbi:Hypothetical predicted protein [Marmota monax]|uniref:Sema domain-containing protein n=1 Tax=Marmota monax TaxID=9995 RepID=A0A5E4B0W9_MARMO|nr:hypothetical protein GHT09_011791 [Marmota monax]VTJ63383.1 Hypothetical predicted protein [Marmota monax]